MLLVNFITNPALQGRVLAGSSFEPQRNFRRLSLREIFYPS